MTAQLAEPQVEAKPAADLSTPVVMTVPFNEATILAVARRLHDSKCYEQRKRGGCTLRDIHAKRDFSESAEIHLSALAAAFAAGELGA